MNAVCPPRPGETECKVRIRNAEAQEERGGGGNKGCFLTPSSKGDGLNRHVIDFRDWARLYDIDNALGLFDVAEGALHEVIHD